MKERNLQLNLVYNKICWLPSALKRNIHKKIKLRLKNFQEHGSNFFFYLLYPSTPPKERQNRNCSLSLSLSRKPCSPLTSCHLLETSWFRTEKSCDSKILGYILLIYLITKNSAKISINGSCCVGKAQKHQNATLSMIKEIYRIKICSN